jgi:hypothetical protein
MPTTGPLEGDVATLPIDRAAPEPTTIPLLVTSQIPEAGRFTAITKTFEDDE